MEIANPRVTLADEARTITDEDNVRGGFLDWLHMFSVTGDDGELYTLGGAILSMNLEKLDVVNISIARGRGGSRQLKNSICRISAYPGSLHARMFRHSAGSLEIVRRERSVFVKCGPEYQVECFDDNSWHLVLDTQMAYTRQIFGIGHNMPRYGMDARSLHT